MVPNGWNTLALSEITKEKISYGIVQAGPHVTDGIPYIKSADVGGEIDVDSLQRTAKEIHHKYRRSSVHPNDIVFSLRGNIARTSIVPTSLQEANLTQGTARISVNDKNDTKFVYYKLASTPILNRINALSKGSTFKEISLEELRKVKLPLPPLEEQRKEAVAKRRIGLGQTGLADMLIMMGLKYGSPEAASLADEVSEFIAVSAYMASVELAKEKGACPLFNETKYAQGIMPIDRHKSAVDDIHTEEYHMDWDKLRNDIMKYGLRNSTLSAFMPSETSSQISNATNGIEPPRGLISIKASKDGILKQVVQQ